jgi:apolipoprotein N-acyltransferase
MKEFIRTFLSILSGLILAFAFPKYEISVLAWIALVPVLAAMRDQTYSLVAVYAFVAGFTLNAITMAWLAGPLSQHAHWNLIAAVASPIAISAVEALFISGIFVAALFVTRRSHLPLLVTLPICWVAVEWIRSFFPLGFPWGLLGYAVRSEGAVIQIAELTGVYGVSALVVLVNVASYDLLFAEKTLRARFIELGGVIALLLVVLVFGYTRLYRLEAPGAENELKVALIQGNIPQDLKWNPAAAAQNFKVYEDATRAAAQSRPDLIIWPETADPYVLQPNAAYPVAFSTELAYHDRVLDLAASTQTNILLGAEGIDFGRTLSAKNRVYLINDRGEMVDYYDKIKLVPFGEYVPMPFLLKHLIQKTVQTPMNIDIGPGEEQTIFKVKSARIGVLICYESIFPELARQAVDKGANILVNVTNDAWYGTSSAPSQLLAMTSLRAVENRVPVITVGNTGITAVITPTGRIQDATQLLSRATDIETLRWNDSMTFYSVVGDLFAEICLALTLMGLLMALVASNPLGGSSHVRAESRLRARSA